MIAAVLFGLMALPVRGQTVADPVTAAVLPGWVKSDGTRVAALQLILAPGWKTYWRAPGDGGIPPQFDWSRSRNLQSVGISWPTPRVFNDNGLRSIGYKNQLIIPLIIAPSTSGKPVRLRAKMELGVCSDICMPHVLHFDAMLEGSGATPTPAIAAALAERPYSAKEAGVRSSTCALEATSDGMRISARVTMPSAGGNEVVVIEPGQADIWVGASQTTRQGGSVVAVSEMMHAQGGAIAIDRSAIRITVLGKNHAVDIRGCNPS
ncbi:MAG: protein-disulfide reductase DsbD domain-containing protein [Sulfitobacter sp.]